MIDLDMEALKAAYGKFIETVKVDQEGAAIADAILAFRQAECKPFKDAPRDGTDIEAYNGNLWETITAVEGYWHACSDGARFCDVDNTTAYTHYRIPFNPEEG